MKQLWGTEFLGWFGLVESFCVLYSSLSRTLSSHSIAGLRGWKVSGVGLERSSLQIHERCQLLNSRSTHAYGETAQLMRSNCLSREVGCLVARGQACRHRCGGPSRPKRSEAPEDVVRRSRQNGRIGGACRTFVGARCSI